MNRPFEDISMPALLVAAGVIAATFGASEPRYPVPARASTQVTIACAGAPPSGSAVTESAPGQREECAP